MLPYKSHTRVKTNTRYKSPWRPGYVYSRVEVVLHTGSYKVMIPSLRFPLYLRNFPPVYYIQGTKVTLAPWLFFFAGRSGVANRVIEYPDPLVNFHLPKKLCARAVQRELARDIFLVCTDRKTGNKGTTTTADRGGVNVGVGESGDTHPCVTHHTPVCCTEPPSSNGYPK